MIHASAAVGWIGFSNSLPHSIDAGIPSSGGSFMQRPVRPQGADSAARTWAPLARFVEIEARIGAWAERRRITLVLYEVTRFGIKQGWACLFGALLLALLLGTHFFYPRGAW